MSRKPPSVMNALAHTWRMTNPWIPMIRDHRGRPTPLYRLDHRWRQPAASADLPSPAFDRVRARLLRTTRRGMGGRPWVLCVIAAGYIVFILWLLSVPQAPRLIIWNFLLIIAIFLLSALTYGRRIPKAGRDAIAHELLAEGRCPSCAYDLSATSPDPDGNSTCPECGAAWIVPRSP